MAKRYHAPPMLIGWREWVRLPELGNAAVKVKVDTGAQTSAIHAWNIKVSENKKGRIATFDLHPLQDDNKTIIHAKAPVVDLRNIKSSNGQVQERVVIETPLELAGRTWMIELTLTRRDEMGFRMLLGRTAMQGHLLVDPSHSFLAGQIR
ncbi:MAG: ATP-dependent zinc protease family protein [Methyloligellaceae bacterium]